MRRVLRSREFAVFTLLVVFVALTWLKQPRMLEPASLNSILLALPILLVVALGELLVLLTRGIDVSVGSMLGLTGMIVGLTFRDHPGVGIVGGTALAVAIGCGLGLVNGLLVALARVPPIIATLGALTAYRGLCFIVSGAKQIDSYNLPDSLNRWSLDGPLRIGQVNIPWTFAMAVGIALLTWLFLSRTRPGRYLYAIGGHEDAARLSGVRVTRLKIAAYTAAGGLSGFGALLYASRYGFVNPATAGRGFELDVIAAVVIGGASILGGSGSALGVFLGCLLLCTVNVALSVMGIDATWQLAAFGTIILVALAADSIVRNRREANA